MANGEFKRASEMIERAVAADSQFAEGRHVDLANWLVLGANWRLISELLPGRTNSLLTGGWLNSLEHGRPADAEGGMLPWMTYAAIDFLEGVLAPDWRVFEWGSGTSTAWWSGRVAAIHAVEHDRQYYDQVADFGLANLTLRLCEQTEDYVGAISSAASGSLDANAASGPLDANAATARRKRRGRTVRRDHHRRRSARGLRPRRAGPSQARRHPGVRRFRPRGIPP